jgi:hypothetical protein
MAARLQACPGRTRYGTPVTAMWRWTAALVLTGAAACGGRALSDDEWGPGCAAAGGAGDGGGSRGGTTGLPRDGGVDASTGGFHFSLEGGVPWDALPIPDAGPVSSCLACIRENCRRPIDSCAQSEACILSVACAALGCPDPNNSLCAGPCSEPQPSGTLASAMALACVLEQCPQSCPTTSLGASDPIRLGSSGAGGAG